MKNIKEQLQQQINKIPELEKLNFENKQKDIWLANTTQILERYFDKRHVENFDRIFNHGCIITEDWDGQKEYIEELEKAKEFLCSLIRESKVAKQKSSPKFLWKLWQEFKDFIARIIANLIKN